MDTLTHAFSAALLARATAGRDPASPDRLSVGTRVMVAALAAMAPDLDFVVWFFSPQRYLVDHRGWTHSLILLPLWAALLAWVFRGVWRGRYTFRAFFPVVAMAIGAHILADILTAYGTQIFAPFTDLRVSIPTTFIIDLGFTGILVLGLLGSALWRRSAAPALIALVVLGAYVGFEAGLRQDAELWGAAWARMQQWEPAEVAVVPQPLSPFNWLVVVDRGYDYHIAYVRLDRKQPASVAPGASWWQQLGAAYAPPATPQWQTVKRYQGNAKQRAFERRAWRASAFGPYRDFSLLPVAGLPRRTPTGSCVRFSDLRFRLPVPRAHTLHYGLCRVDGHWEVPTRAPS